MQKKLFKTLILSLVMVAFATTVFAARHQATTSQYTEYEKGLAHLKTGNVQAALASFEVCVKNYDNYAEAYKNIALIKYAEGSLLDAIIALDKSLLEKPDAETYVLQATYFEEYGSRRSAIRVLNKAIELDRTNPAYYEYRAKLKNALGEKDSALVDLYYVQELRAGRTDIVSTNSKKMRTYTISTPLSSETARPSDNIELHLYK